MSSRRSTILCPNWIGVNRTDNAQKKYHPNGAIIILNAAKYRRTMSYYMERTYGYLMDWESSVDIDEEKDFRIAELVINGIKGGLLAGRPE
jgi:CMP-N-acetylneuraminic acid synthetase